MEASEGDGKLFFKDMDCLKQENSFNWSGTMIGIIGDTGYCQTNHFQFDELRRAQHNDGSLPATQSI